jgi:hypothetical protein
MTMHPFRKQFRALYKASMKEHPVGDDAAIKDLFEKVEAAAIEHFGPIEEHQDDGFGPPPSDIEVECRHCRQKYLSSEMVRQYRPGVQANIVGMLGKDADQLDPMWWCKNFKCDGAGFGYDIFPVEQKG